MYPIDACANTSRQQTSLVGAFIPPRWWYSRNAVPPNRYRWELWSLQNLISNSLRIHILGITQFCAPYFAAYWTPTSQACCTYAQISLLAVQGQSLLKWASTSLVQDGIGKSSNSVSALKLRKTQHGCSYLSFCLWIDQAISWGQCFHHCYMEECVNFLQLTNIYPRVWHVDSWCSSVGVAYSARMKIVEMDSVDGNNSTFSIYKELYFQDILSTACLRWRCPTNHSSMIHGGWKSML